MSGRRTCQPTSPLSQSPGGWTTLLEQSSRWRGLTSPVRLMTGFDLGQIAKELPDGWVAGACRGPRVEVSGLGFHRLGLMANRRDVESLRHPNGPALDETPHVLSPNQRDVIAKPLLEQVEKHPAVAALRLGHVHEDLCGSGVALLQTLRELAVDPPVLFLRLDGESQDLPIRQIGERTLRPGRKGHCNHLGTPRAWTYQNAVGRLARVRLRTVSGRNERSPVRSGSARS